MGRLHYFVVLIVALLIGAPRSKQSSNYPNGKKGGEFMEKNSSAMASKPTPKWGSRPNHAGLVSLPWDRRDPNRYDASVTK